MKKILALILALAVALTLFACASLPSSGKIPGKQTEETTDKESEKQTQTTEEPKETTTEAEPEPELDVPGQEYSADGGTSIDVLREEINQAEMVFGVGYVGYFEYDETVGIDFAQWYASTASPFAATYPFFSEIDANHTIGESGYLYCILAKDYESSVTVTDSNGETLYCASNGDPILLFCDPNGDGKTEDLTVTITAPDGKVYVYAPTVDDLGYPQLLVGDERTVHSWTIMPREESTISLDDLFAQGWLGISDYGLSGGDVQNPNIWTIYVWDEEKLTTAEFSLTFYSNPAANGATDGEVVMQCFYENESGVQAEWEGWWKVEIEPDRESVLRLDLMLMRGEDMAHYEADPLSENYYAMIHPNGETLLLIPLNGYSALPFLGGSSVELTLAMG